MPENFLVNNSLWPPLAGARTDALGLVLRPLQRFRKCNRADFRKGLQIKNPAVLAKCAACLHKSSKRRPAAFLKMANGIERDTTAISKLLLGYVSEKPPFSHRPTYATQYLISSAFYHINIPI